MKQYVAPKLEFFYCSDDVILASGVVVKEFNDDWTTEGGL